MTDQQQIAFESAMAATGSKATYTGAGTSVAAWAFSSEFGILVGVVLGVAGFVVNWFYKARHDRRQQAEHDLKMKALK